ncbi:lipocalin/fatty-acid binding family protein, partial [Erythrobacter sp. SN021]|uniref:lipocalin/fatty-acid binding family protein n=1 Tax=Erythrobacter sp. SN021 TaxID=2912574 RepID=UPI001F41DA12
MSGEEPTSGEEKPNFQGKYALVRNENFESFLEANGANWMIRKMAGAASPVLEITQDGDTFGVKLQSMFHSKDQSFKIG